MICNECGAALSDLGVCRDHFDALLFLESQLLQTADATFARHGDIAHFYAVGSYALQHPQSFGHMQDALLELLHAMCSHLDGHETMAEIRLRIRRATNGRARIERRPGDTAPSWGAVVWPMNICDALDGPPAGYCDRVTAWARAVCVAVEEPKR